MRARVVLNTLSRNSHLRVRRHAAQHAPAALAGAAAPGTACRHALSSEYDEQSEGKEDKA
jgi:hypothetical protein